MYSSLLFAKRSESDFKLDASLLLKKLLAPKVANLFKRSVFIGGGGGVPVPA